MTMMNCNWIDSILKAGMQKSQPFLFFGFCIVKIYNKIEICLYKKRTEKI